MLACGKDALIITTGRMTDCALQVAEKLKNDRYSASVIALPTIKPLDKELILRHIAPFTAVIEDHCADCGLGSLSAKVLAENNADTTLKIFGFPNEPVVHGTISELDRHYKLDSESIYTEIKESIKWLKK